MKIREMSISERPVEKLVLYGKESLASRELLAILLRSGTKDEGVLSVADKILNKNAEGLRNLTDITLEELMEIDGVGQTKAAVVLAAVELGRRISVSEALEQGSIECVEDVAEMFMERMRYLKREFFEALLIDAKGGIIAKETVSVGDLSSSVVHPRETFKYAIKRSAAAVIFIHNHPSGDPTPSVEDLELTKRLVEAGNILGISVLDHIVIGDGTFVSMKMQELI